MSATKAQAQLRDGVPMPGYFAAAGCGDDVAGVLTWSVDDGARLELVEPTSKWPAMGEPPFVVRGTLRDGGDLTLLDAWVKRTSWGDQVMAVNAGTLAFGEHVEPDAKWTRAVYETANLTEWRRDTGLSHSHPNDDDINHFRVDSQLPAKTEIELPDACLTFQGSRSTEVAYASGWQIETSQRLVVNPTEPITVREGWRRFAGPLLNLTSFASDRPDGTVYEVFRDPEQDTQIEIWRQGLAVRPREWNPVRGYIFHADDLPDYPEAIKRWWTLDELLRPALGLFADHIRHGSSFSPSRFLTLYTAIEAYARERHGRNDFKRLRAFAGLPNDVTGCTDDAFRLIGGSRKYFAHLGRQRGGPTVEEIEANTLQSTRRASALMQACLLREIGFDTEQAEALLRKHYSNWPLH